MRSILVTGANGLLGSHAVIALSGLGYKVKAAGREIFASQEAMSNALKECDLVLHFAARIRGSAEELIHENRQINERLIEGVEREKVRPHVVFSSSINADRDDPHGASKREAAELLAKWSKANGAKCTIAYLPHIFGEGGRPNHNSVISTFASMIASAVQPEISNDGEIEPLHAQRAIDHLLEHVESGKSGEIRPVGRKMKVSQLLAKLNEFDRLYRSHVIPDLRQAFDLDLFNTYRSYLYPSHYPVLLKKHTDNRGELIELVRELNGGQVFYSVTKPGITRGQHFHRRKVERFLVLSGNADIGIRRVDSTEKQVFSVNGDEPCYVDIPTLHTHNITNTGSENLVTLFWVHELFDPKNPDTYSLDV